MLPYLPEGPSRRYQLFVNQLISRSLWRLLGFIFERLFGREYRLEQYELDEDDHSMDLFVSSMRT